MASMGPRARARGNAHKPIRCNDFAFSLQWGHERALVEMPSARPPPDPTSGLQWGHERALVEIKTAARNEAQRVSGFNGATSARSWKSAEQAKSIHCIQGFNGATSARSWKY